MESLNVLAVLLLVAVSSVSLECTDGNCTDTIPVLSVNIGSIFPFFSPVNIDEDQSDDLDISIPAHPSDKPNPQGDMSVDVFMEVISFPDDGDSPIQSNPFLQLSSIFDSMGLQRLKPLDFGVLDLSGKNLTGDEIVSQLQARQLQGNPVTTLVLSNSRVQGMTAETFQPVEDTLRELRMDNCSVSLAALTRLSNLRLLNLSNTGLSSFEWFPQLKDTLMELDLSHNQLEEVRPELSVLTSLQKLNLSHNRIVSVKDFPLTLLPNLEVISLTMNSLSDATFTSLYNLQLLEVDWNYLWRCGHELRLPEHRMSVKMASNPWRCDCGLLNTRDNYDVLDLDNLKCANEVSFSVCDDCSRYYLPAENGRSVSNLTKETIDYLDCNGLSDQYYVLRNALGRLSDEEPEKLYSLVMMFIVCVLLVLAAVLICMQSFTKKKFDRKHWLKIQQIPYLKIDKLSKPQEVPYVKMDPTVNA